MLTQLFLTSQGNSVFSFHIQYLQLYLSSKLLRNKPVYFHQDKKHGVMLVVHLLQHHVASLCTPHYGTIILILYIMHYWQLYVMHSFLYLAKHTSLSFLLTSHLVHIFFLVLFSLSVCKVNLIYHYIGF